MQKIILLLTLLIALILHNTCSESTAPPPPPDNEPDTTSHDFFWQIDTVGSYNSIFRDVAVINDSLIWAVGEIYDDERTKYGAAIWNGSKWSFRYFRLPTMSGGTIVPYGIWAFDKNNIWLPGGHIFKWDGSKFYRAYKILDDLGGVYRVWASSENDVWFVGYKGRIIHYDGSSFTTMEKLTDIELTDIWGTGPDNVWACGYTNYNGTVILHYDGSSWRKFHDRPWDDGAIYTDTTGISGTVKSVWTNSEDYIWVLTYRGLHKVNSQDVTDFVLYPEISDYHIWVEKIRGIAENDILICGSFTAFWHFNGNSTYYYPEFPGHVKFLSITTHNNNFYIVGDDYATDRAIIVTGRR